MIRIKCLLYFVMVVLIFATVNGEITVDTDNLLVSTRVGDILGHYDKTINNNTFIAFEGIPYAKANRYEEAGPASWKGVWIANTLYKCIQYYHYTEPGQDFVIGEEDCLYLNVYIPRVRKSRPYDVIVFIHGGAFMFNNGGTYGPKILLDNEVIYVSINYRLGPLGFLSTEDNAIPSNLGLRDQVLALEWIKEHISSFGGHKESITLSGMSAGGASVHIHTMSPLTRDKNFFQKAFIQSGVAINAWALVEKSREKSQKLADIVGCPTENSKDLVECLKSRPARQIVAAVKHFQPWLYNPFSPFGVVIDSWSQNPILPEHPYVTLQNGHNIQNIPVIFSNVQAEGLYPGADFIGDPNGLQKINTEWNELIPFILDFNNTVRFEDRDEVSQRIRDEYFKDGQVNEKTFKNLIQMISDRLFISDIGKAAKLHARNSKSSVYYYVYSYRGAHSKSEYRSKSNRNYGTSHGDDTIYVLSSNVNCHTTEQDRQMSRIFQDMWLHFADGIRNIEWSPLSKTDNNIKYLRINSPDDIYMKEVEYLGNRPFWDSLPMRENHNLFRQKDEL